MDSLSTKLFHCKGCSRKFEQWYNCLNCVSSTPQSNLQSRKYYPCIQPHKLEPECQVALAADLHEHLSALTHLSNHSLDAGWIPWIVSSKSTKSWFRDKIMYIQHIWCSLKKSLKIYTHTFWGDTLYRSTISNTNKSPARSPYLRAVAISVAVSLFTQFYQKYLNCA